MDAVDHGAEVMQLAQSSTNEDDFAAKLSQRFGFTAVQSRAVADMPISRYCPLWRNRLEREVQQLREDLESS
ncbi:DNA gyrase subunit A [Nocardia otitidiscaviarum]|uniref:DNA gyrase subunit A n=1 Tax=Nocardia otitidiscaviarum TaxID=1823 RepID=A0A378YL24_9NOCA|nr:hypothetical protein [Nocardia otitidiscaviarum]SUA77844.1 DNA gyrase subunit A [Nocardia otitidiscaviarum]